MNPISRFVSRVVAVLLQAVLFIAGLVFVASLVAVALFAALLTVIGSLLLGRKPVLRARMADPRAAWSRFRPSAAPRPQGEVIDIEVRDVTPAFDGQAQRRG